MHDEYAQMHEIYAYFLLANTFKYFVRQLPALTNTITNEVTVAVPVAV